MGLYQHGDVGMRNGRGWSSGEQFGEEADAAEIHLDGCSDFKNLMGVCDEACYCNDVEGGEREVVKGME